MKIARGRAAAGRRRRRRQLNGERIDDLLGDDGLGVGGIRTRAVGDRRRPVERENDVGGGRLASVVELDSAAQLGLPGRLVDRAPGDGERGNQLALGVDGDERLVDVAAQRADRVVVEEMRIDGDRAARQADLDFLGMPPAASVSASAAAPTSLGKDGKREIDIVTLPVRGCRAMLQKATSRRQRLRIETTRLRTFSLTRQRAAESARQPTLTVRRCGSDSGAADPVLAAVVRTPERLRPGTCWR